MTDLAQTTLDVVAGRRWFGGKRLVVLISLLLVICGADPDLKCQRGNSAVDMAEAKGNTYMVQALRDAQRRVKEARAKAELPAPAAAASGPKELVVLKEPFKVEKETPRKRWWKL